MKKTELFLKAMNAGEFRRIAWVVSGFSMIREPENEWQKNPYAYRIVQLNTGNYFVDPDAENQLSLIDDAPAGKPIWFMREPIELSAGDLVNLDQDVKTTHGNVISNWLLFCWPLGNKIPFQLGHLKPRVLEDLVLAKLGEDSPPPGVARDPNVIYIDEYIKFKNAAFFLPGFTQLCVPSATAKTMTRDPRMPELKAKLLEENKDRLHDPTVIAKIQAELVQLDRDWMKGDLGADFYAVSGKAYPIVRSKAYGMHGAETGIEEKVDVTLIKNSLSEGWDITKFPAMNDSLRAGSFNRGHQTMLGGESVKWLLRASANMTVAADDCGSALGMEFDVDAGNCEKLVGFSVVSGKTSVAVDEDNAKSYVGQTVMIRSPMFCKLAKTDYCKVCVGKLLAANPNGLSVAVADYGSAFLAIFLALAHGKALILAKLDYVKSIT